MQVWVIVKGREAFLAGDEAYESKERAKREIAELGLDPVLYTPMQLEVRLNNDG